MNHLGIRFLAAVSFAFVPGCGGEDPLPPDDETVVLVDEGTSEDGRGALVTTSHAGESDESPPDEVPILVRGHPEGPFPGCDSCPKPPKSGTPGMPGP